MDKTSIKAQRLGSLFCILGALSWGISGACSQAFFRDYAVDTVWVFALRLGVSGLILFPYSLITKKISFKALKADPRGCLDILIFTLMGLMLCQMSYISAIRWTNAGTATVLQNLSVVYVAVVTCVITRRLPEKRVVLCIILALLGVFLIATGGRFDSLQLTPKGMFWGFMAGVGAGSYTLLSVKPVKKWGSSPILGLGMFAGGLIVVPLTKAWQIPDCLDLRGWLLLGAIVIVGTVISFGFFLSGIRLVGPVKGALLGCLEPLVATLLSVVWLHTSFSIADIFGFICIMLTVLLVP
ncbi:MAG: EamA family transporter [Lachnospiraceae bacterium]|nr:EamA family transporter [Candidatus Equihabitans merdae]